MELDAKKQEALEYHRAEQDPSSRARASCKQDARNTSLQQEAKLKVLRLNLFAHLTKEIGLY